MLLSVLGPVLIDGHQPPGAKERALLARLMVTPGAPVAVDELLEAAWPRERSERAIRSLHVRLAKLRALLEPCRARGAPAEVLLRDAAGYRLALPAESVDAERFARLAGETAALPPAAALDRAEAALALWRGEPFAELDTVEAARAEARRLGELRDRLLHLRAVALREAGRPEEAAAELTRLVEDDPLREDLVRDLMLARYRAGRQAEALDAYRELARRLSALGLQPSPRVRELEGLVLRHAAPHTHPTNLGAPVASVVGREAELRAVASALDGHRIVTLIGPGGVGKTTLAHQAARALLAGMPDGAWAVRLAPLRETVEVLPAVAAALGVSDGVAVAGAADGGIVAGAANGDVAVPGAAVAGTASAAAVHDSAGLRARLRHATALLVLDGAEHLVPAIGAVVRELAAAGPGVRVLVTSRRPLGLAGEAVIAIRPLALPRPGAGAEEVERSPAGRLFVERARAARPCWHIGPEEAAAVVRICHRLDGLPLALELAASRLRALSAPAIADRLDRGLDVLGRGTLDASVEASYALLAPAERALLDRLSAFERPFELEDAERVAGLPEPRVLDLLVSLTEHSLVQAEHDAPRRYRILAPLRAFARARPAAVGIA